MDPPADSEKNNTSSSSDVNLGIFKANVDEITALQNSQAVQSRSQNAIRDESEDKTKLLLTGLQKVTAKHIDDSIAQRSQTEAEFERMNMMMKSMQAELTRICTRSERQRIGRAWITPPITPPGADVPASYPTLCQPFEQRRTEMLATHGIVKTRQKKMMLQIWRAKGGSNGNPMQALLLKMSRFLKRNVISLDLSVDELFDLVIDQIPDYDWLKFARTELGLMESEIRKVKQTCEPTEEQLYQLSLEGGAED